MNIDPREWELQERAMREDTAYREVARALRRSPGEPPADFAAATAALVEHGDSTMHAPTREGELERWLVRVLSAVLGVAGIGVLARSAREWIGGFDAIAAMLGGPGAINWAMAAGACVLLSWAFAQGALHTGLPRH